MNEHTISVVCCRCGTLKPGSCPVVTGESPSTGICPDCFEDMYLKDFDAEELAEMRAMILAAWGRDNK